MKFVSWNVNGFRACLKKGFEETFDTLDADFFCLQETKMQPGQADFQRDNYEEFYNSAEKKGYSGTAVFAKEKPMSVRYGIDTTLWSSDKNNKDVVREGHQTGTTGKGDGVNSAEPLMGDQKNAVTFGSDDDAGRIPTIFDLANEDASESLQGCYNSEGRVITLEYPDFYLICAYVPNSQNGLKRIDFRMQFEDDMRNYLMALDREKPIIYCGDLNVAHEEIDLKNPGPNRGNAGFSDEERQKMTELLSSGFTDTFRYLHPDETGAYSWWSYRFHARDTNAGWRIDYFIVSDRLRSKITDAKILSTIYGSDHCPVELDIDL